MAKHKGQETKKTQLVKEHRTSQIGRGLRKAGKVAPQTITFGFGNNRR